MKLILSFTLLALLLTYIKANQENDERFVALDGYDEDLKYLEERFDDERFVAERFDDERFVAERFDDERFVAFGKSDDERFIALDEYDEDLKYLEERFDDERFIVYSANNVNDDERFVAERFDDERFEAERFDDDIISRLNLIKQDINYYKKPFIVEDNKSLNNILKDGQKYIKKILNDSKKSQEPQGTNVPQESEAAQNDEVANKENENKTESESLPKKFLKFLCFFCKN